MRKKEKNRVGKPRIRLEKKVKKVRKSYIPKKAQTPHEQKGKKKTKKEKETTTHSYYSNCF